MIPKWFVVRGIEVSAQHPGGRPTRPDPTRRAPA
jgi:hypothetical protein